MHIPPNYTKREVLDILDNIANRLAARFRFSYYELDDIKQEAKILGMEALPKYKAGRPLENFLFVHVKNRLCTLKRDRYVRPKSDAPCNTSKCPFNCYVKKDDFCEHYEGQGLTKMDCEVYRNWVNRNKTKQNIKDTLHYSQVKSDGESNMSYEINLVDGVDGREMMEKVKNELPIEYLKDFQCLTAGIDVPKQRRLALLAEIKNILGMSGGDNV